MQTPSRPGSGNGSMGGLFAKISVLTLYLGLNISLNMLNKWVLSHYGFRFPLLMSMCHMAFSFFTLGPIMLFKSFRDLHSATLQKQWLGLIGVGVFFAVNIGFNNVSLVTISLSLNQVIRASIPIVTALSSIFIENKSPTRQEFLSLLILASGVGIAVWEGSGSKSSFNGILICLIGTVCNGLMMSTSGKLMSEKIDVLRLTFYTAPVSCFILIPFFVQLESADFSAYLATAKNSNFVGVIMLTCINALAYNMVHYLMIKHTSSVTTTVLGEMKIIVILLLSAVMLGESKIWTFKMLVGCTTAILGFCLYSHSKLQTPSNTWQPVIKGVPELPVSLSERSPLLKDMAPKQSL